MTQPNIHRRYISYAEYEYIRQGKIDTMRERIEAKHPRKEITTKTMEWIKNMVNIQMLENYFSLTEEEYQLYTNCIGKEKNTRKNLRDY